MNGAGDSLQVRAGYVISFFFMMLKAAVTRVDNQVGRISVLYAWQRKG